MKRDRRVNGDPTVSNWDKPFQNKPQGKTLGPYQIKGRTSHERPRYRGP